MVGWREEGDLANLFFKLNLEACVPYFISSACRIFFCCIKLRLHSAEMYYSKIFETKPLQNDVV